jgi:hypothetical protein
MYGKGNSGPAREVWKIGDRVECGGFHGTVATPRWEPNASETHYVWVEWDDDVRGYINPNVLDAILPQ